MNGGNDTRFCAFFLLCTFNVWFGSENLEWVTNFNGLSLSNKLCEVRRINRSIPQDQG